MGGLKQQKCIFSQFRRLEVQNQGVSRTVSSQVPGRESVLGRSPNFQGCPPSSASLGLQLQVNSSLCLHPQVVVFPVCASLSVLSSSYEASSHIGLRAHLTPVMTYSSLIASAETLFPYKITYRRTGSQDLTIFFWDTVQNNTPTNGLFQIPLSQCVATIWTQQIAIRLCKLHMISLGGSVLPLAPEFAFTVRGRSSQNLKITPSPNTVIMFCLRV